MTPWIVPLLPTVVAGALWSTGGHVAASRRRLVLGAAAVTALLASAAAAWWVGAADAVADYDVGAGLRLVLDPDPLAEVVAVVVPLVAAAIVAYAAAHEPLDGLPRLVGLLTAFTGVMLLLVLAADLLTLTVAWELVGALSWVLIAHRWGEAEPPRSAAHAFNVTRLGGLGLFLAAGAAFATTGSLAFEDLGRVTGVRLDVVAGGVLVAAAAKSAQVPFAPWLFSAMAGPTPVSALLHSSTMVAAGAFALARLHPVLEPAGWFRPTTIAIGLVTALLGGIVASIQGHAKKLLAASTSAHYGLMFVAVGAGFPQVALLHLVVHAAFKAQLFLSAGVAISAVGSERLSRMRLGSHLRATAVLTAVASLALAGVPPLAGAFSKETILAAAVHEGAWVGVLVAIAGGLSALYAARFQLLAFGPHRGDAPSPRAPVHRPGQVERGAIGVLAIASILLGILWLPAGSRAAGRLLGDPLPEGATWELVLSLALVSVAIYGVWAADRGGRLGAIPATARSRTAAEWLGLSVATRRMIVDPTLTAVAALARFDDRVVDAGVRGAARVGAAGAAIVSRLAEPTVDGLVRSVAALTRQAADASARFAERAVDAAVSGTAWLVGRAGADARRVQTGLVHHQYVVIAAGLLVVALAAVIGR